MATTYKVLSENIDGLKAKIEKLNKKARKLGVEEITLTIGPRAQEKHEDPTTGFAEWVVYYPVEVTGASPIINGWRFVATLDHTDEGTLIRSVPDTGIDFTPYYNAVPYCDHCKLIRKRNDTYLVERVADHVLRQVGSNCLADFLGHKSPQAYAEQAEMIMAANEACASGERGTGSGEHYYDLETYLMWIAATMRQYGWVSRGKAREENCAATADIAMGEWELKQTGRTNSRHVFPTEKDRELATLALEWAQGLDNPDNDYLHNVWVVAKGFAFTWRQQGLAGSIVAAYMRNSQQKASVAQSQHVGTVGKPFEGVVTVVGLSYTPGYMGNSTTVVNMQDKDSNSLVWFATNDPDLHKGEQYVIRATVKKHGDFRGAAQTVLTRAKMTPVAALLPTGDVA